MKKTLLSFILAFSVASYASAQVYTPGASALTSGELNQPYAGQVINVSIPITTTVSGSILTDALVAAVGPAAGAAAGILAGLDVDFTVSSTNLTVNGLPAGLTATCDVSSCDYSGGASGTITISGTPSEAGSFTIDINSSTGGTADLSALISQLPFNPGVPSTLPLPQPAPGILDETGYTLEIDDPNSIEEVNDVFALSFYPNPTIGESTLEVNSIEGGVANIEVFSITGSRVLATSESITVGLNRIVLDMNNVPAGVYMIRTQINGEQALIRTQKI